MGNGLARVLESAAANRIGDNQCHDDCDELFEKHDHKIAREGGYSRNFIRKKSVIFFAGRNPPWRKERRSFCRRMQKWSSEDLAGGLGLLGSTMQLLHDPRSRLRNTDKDHILGEVRLNLVPLTEVAELSVALVEELLGFERAEVVEMF